ncbi:hypothetical protein MKX01_028893 [Papaver californicum]|nr:hypothetical protein MKX01_028893 [Papaver californicum]
MNSSQNPNTVIPIQTSLDGLVKSWKRRQKWQLLFHYQEPENLSSNKKQRAPWRIRLAKFLESTPVHKEWSGLLLLVSLWRIVRVVESVFELSNEAMEAKIVAMQRQFEALQRGTNYFQL